MNSAEEKAPNSKSSTELPGANRSWVAVGDDPEALQQSGWDDVKTEGVPQSPLYRMRAKELTCWRDERLIVRRLPR